MYLDEHFAAIAAWLLLAITVLLWVTACALTATKMEKKGIAFWKGFLTSFLLSPLVGLMMTFIPRILRPSRPLAHTVGHS